MEPPTAPNGKPRVFIGSSTEGLNIAQRLKMKLEESHQVAATVWTDGVFEPMKGHLENLVANTERYDFAIVVLTPDMTVIARGSSDAVARENVVMEVGYFVGRFGRDRTFVVVCKDDLIQLPSYLIGTTIMTYMRSEDGNLASSLTEPAIKMRDQMMKLGPRRRELAVAEPPVPRSFDRSDGGPFTELLERLFATSKRVVLIGTGLNILSKDPVRDALMHRAAEGECEVELYLADPLSPAVHARLVEEELGKELFGGVKPTVGRPGLLQRLDGLLDDWRRLGSPARVSLRLFGNYPTFALIIVDDQYFVYPYGYALLGNFSPVARFSAAELKDRAWVAFLQGQYERIKKASVSTEAAMHLREDGVPPASLHAFALYFVPPRGSALYEFGSSVLGCDIRMQAARESRWEGCVGGAKPFGFHLTCCDALYFYEPHEIALATEEVAFVAREFAPFDLEDLEVTPHFPDASSIALVPRDPSGSIEALQAEFVHRVYRRAAASNYSLGRARPVRDTDLRRAALMISRYKAPYILQRFRPHFTLLTNVPAADHERIAGELRAAFETQVPERRIRFDKLAVMKQGGPGGLWQIAREIKLG